MYKPVKGRCTRYSLLWSVFFFTFAAGLEDIFTLEPTVKPEVMRVAVVGATGLVGRKLAAVLEQRSFPVDEFIPVASEASVGRKVQFAGKEYTVTGMEEALLTRPHLVFFSAGAETSRQWAKLFAERGSVVIDNSSAWRSDDSVPLLVPEVNSHILNHHHRLISNPNCSTIQLVVAINPIYKHYGIRRLVISTYQSVTGTGQKAVQQLRDEQQAKTPSVMAYPHPIHENIIPHGGQFDDEGYTTEERKLEQETRKIMDAPEIGVTATVVRVPVLGGHSVSANIETESNFSIEDIRRLLSESSGIVLQDDPAANLYPMPIIAQNRDEVFVGRLRSDSSHPRAFNMWIVSDNLRKGAATNAVQIAEMMLSKKLLPAL
jgi:aspartate-semialdehyde dehydrogenase